MTATGPIGSFAVITPGSGYKAGTYSNVALLGGSGAYGVATIVIATSSNGAKSVAFYSPTTALTLDRTGQNYQIGDSVNTDNTFDGVGLGTGFSVTVGTLARACENCFFGLVIPPLPSSGNLAYKRYCANSAYINSPVPVAQAPEGWQSLIVQEAFWCGEGADKVSGTSFSSIVNTLPSTVVGSAPGTFSTGDAKITLKTTADSGWIIMDDGTIGSGASAASTRANDDCQDLFTLLWNNIADADAPVVTGRGATAAADWAANKKITLTKQLGRALAVAGAGATLTARALGHKDGAETVVIAAGALPTHTHGVVDPTHAHAESVPGVAINVNVGDGSFGTASVGGPPAGGASGNSGTGIALANAGTSTAQDVMNPRTYWNVMIKL